MVRKPYRVANSRKTKRQPVTPEILADHNAKKVREFKAKNKRHSRRQTNKAMKDYVTDIKKGRHVFYFAERERQLNEQSTRPIHTSKPTRFRLRDSWPNSRDARS